MRWLPSRNPTRRGPRDRSANILFHDQAPATLAWLVFAVMGANALAYIVAYADPIVTQDAWIFLGGFVHKAIEGKLEFGDFFAKHAATSHAQPLKRLALLWELRSFDLDLSIQAIIGLACAGASLLVLRYLVFRDGASHYRYRCWVWLGMCVVFLSLNSRMVWTWPLVTGGFIAYLLFFMLLACLWRYLQSGRMGALVCMTLLVDLAADDRAILATIACLLTLGLVALKDRQLRRWAWRAMVVLAACLVAVRIAYPFFSAAPPGSLATDLGARLGELGVQFADGGWWQWIVVPLASSIAHHRQLTELAHAETAMAQIVLGLLLAAAHVWFWWKAWRAKPNAAWFGAVASMLFFYAMLAGIIYVRVAHYGNDYLGQPRYVLIYSFGNIALLLMCASLAWQPKTHRATRAIIMALVTALAILQVPLAQRTWHVGRFSAAYQQKMSDQLWFMARNDYRAPDDCLPTLFVCNMKKSARARLIGLLQDNRLNVFSPALRARHKIHLPRDRHDGGTQATQAESARPDQPGKADSAQHKPEKPSAPQPESGAKPEPGHEPATRQPPAPKTITAIRSDLLSASVAVIEDCTSKSATIRWDVRQAYPQVEKIRIYLHSPSGSTLFAQAGPAGEVGTENWLRAGKAFTLVAKKSGEQLAHIRIGGKLCR